MSLDTLAIKTYLIMFNHMFVEDDGILHDVYKPRTAYWLGCHGDGIATSYIHVAGDLQMKVT